MVPCLAYLPFYASTMGSSLTSVGDFAGGFWETSFGCDFSGYLLFPFATPAQMFGLGVYVMTNNSETVYSQHVQRSFAEESFVLEIVSTYLT